MGKDDQTEPSVRDLIATLIAYRRVQRASWPELNPEGRSGPAQWAQMGRAELEAELARLVAETELPGRGVRVFWKVGDDLAYAGCNVHFAHDAGFASAAELIGKTDFDPGISWLRQSAKYRRDDLEVVRTGVEKLDIIERQDSSAGTIWLRTGKAAIRPDRGRSIGILGMYEVIDAATAARLSRGR